ncbi:MAG: ATP citrate lyase citrate-binding domain-containing protein, partial [Thermodesulfobacteriota bacterium]
WTEYFGKENPYGGAGVLVTPETDLTSLAGQHAWLSQKKLVVKPDQLFGKRGKHHLVLIDATLEQALEWIRARMNAEATIGGVTDALTHFLVEEYVPHEDEYYVAVKSEREADQIYFSTQGGVDIEALWHTVITIKVPVLGDIDDQNVSDKLPQELPSKRRQLLANFIKGLFRFYVDLGFTYLEINPFIFSGDAVIPLDLVARLDDTAFFQSGRKWGDLEFPPPFGRRLTTEEAYIKELDRNSGASMKLSVLNPAGRVWTMVAGGGASVIYADTVADLGFGTELANYGEYSGNPSTDETYEYAKTILDLMCRTRDPRGKVLIIGGGIANFTDVASTFTGIIKAIKEYARKLIDNRVSIYVRRGGPNYQTGLNNMKILGRSLGVPIHVYGPELHMTRIVKMALLAKEDENA